MPSTVRAGPSVGRSKPTQALSSVDLPEPFGPTSAVMLPSGTARSTSRSAQRRRPYRLPMPCVSRTAIGSSRYRRGRMPDRAHRGRAAPPSDRSASRCAVPGFPGPGTARPPASCGHACRHARSNRPARSTRRSPSRSSPPSRARRPARSRPYDSGIRLGGRRRPARRRRRRPASFTFQGRHPRGHGRDRAERHDAHPAARPVYPEVMPDPPTRWNERRTRADPDRAAGADAGPDPG